MDLNLEVSGGSAAGYDHRKKGTNRQDAYSITQTENAVVVIIADGCGSSPHSEVGASLATQLMSHSLQRHLASGYPRNQMLFKRAQQDVLSHLSVLAGAMGPSLSEVVTNYLLFTILGVVTTPEDTTFFGLGDGVFAINGELTPLEPEAGNKPIYLAYALTGSELTDEDPAKLDLKIWQQLPTSEVDTFLIGSDGANDLQAAAERPLPGRDELVGPLSQFWENPKFTGGKTFVERRLGLITRSWVRTEPNGHQVTDGGKVGDDITIVVGRNLNYLTNPSTEPLE